MNGDPAHPHDIVVAPIAAPIAVRCEVIPLPDGRGHLTILVDERVAATKAFPNEAAARAYLYRVLGCATLPPIGKADNE